MSEVTGLICWMDSKLKLGCLTLVQIKCYKYVGSTIVLPAEIDCDRLTLLRQLYDTSRNLTDVGRNSYWIRGRPYRQDICRSIHSRDYSVERFIEIEDQIQKFLVFTSVDVRFLLVEVIANTDELLSEKITYFTNYTGNVLRMLLYVRTLWVLKSWVWQYLLNSAIER
jgi:hypothetical protein